MSSTSRARSTAAPSATSLERERLATSTLAFPGRVLADEGSRRLFIADSNHHRILVASLDGRVMDVVGGGAAGSTDGAFGAARFYRPQGMALDRDVLYVADTENHVVRSANLATRQVSTLAGTGRQGARGGQGGLAREAALSSPWDLQVSGRLLFVAMAGTHQIWMIDLDRQLAFPYAGSGREARVDGPVDEAAFAQPSGLALDAGTLFVADSESNIIRAIALPPKNAVRTLAGGDLFEFGDRDGFGDEARLQHPMALAFRDGRLYVADTYNHRIKVMLPAERRVRAFAGDGESGHLDGPLTRARFHEPGGVTATSDAVYVADTNNHAVRTIRLADAVVGTLRLDGA